MEKGALRGGLVGGEGRDMRQTLLEYHVFFSLDGRDFYKTRTNYLFRDVKLPTVADVVAGAFGALDSCSLAPPDAKNSNVGKCVVLGEANKPSYRLCQTTLSCLAFESVLGHRCLFHPASSVDSFSQMYLLARTLEK